MGRWSFGHVPARANTYEYKNHQINKIMNSQEPAEKIQVLVKRETDNSITGLKSIGTGADGVLMRN